jgi:cobalt-zinc-cadmium efflux system outer membrane protein
MRKTFFLLAAMLATLNLGRAPALAAEAAVPATNTRLAPDPISIDTLVAEALAKNPELKFYEAEMAVAKAGRRSAGLLPNPELSASVGRKTSRGPDLNGEGIAWSVSVLQPLEWPGRLGLRKAIANHDVELAELGFSRFKVALAARVRNLAFGVFAAQERSAAASEVAARFKALRETLVQRDPAGITPLLEIRVIEATELNAQRKATEAKLAAQAALFELNQLRGVAPDVRFSVAPPSLSFPPVEKSDALLALARGNNFELRVRAAELAQQGFRVALAKNERYPTISVGPTISEERAGDRERTIGVGVSLPLPVWNRNTSNVEIAKARQVQAETSLLLAQRETERKVLEAALTYETKVGEMAQWRPESVQQFQEAAELADRHYRLGAVPVATYVELQKQYLEAVESLLDTRREALESAAQLELLTGASLPLTTKAEK